MTQEQLEAGAFAARNMTHAWSGHDAIIVPLFGGLADILDAMAETAPKEPKI